MGNTSSEKDRVCMMKMFCFFERLILTIRHKSTSHCIMFIKDVSLLTLTEGMCMCVGESL